MTRTPVQSSNVAAVGYSIDTMELEIEFRGGAVYLYHGVKPEVHGALMASESKGRFVAHSIKPLYTFTRLDDPGAIMPERIELRERIAYVQHDIWAHWQAYVFGTCGMEPDGSVVIPPALVERWSRQIDTPYTELTEAEKDSDREQAAKVLAVVVAPLREA